MIRSLLIKLGATLATCHAHRTSQQAGRLGRRRFTTRSAAAWSALSLSLGIGALAATPAGAAVTTVNGSVITSPSGVAYPVYAGAGYVARDTFVLGARYEHRDFWTGAVTVDRHLDVSPGVIHTGRNPAAGMRAQVTLQRWNGSSWAHHYRWPQANGSMSFFNNNVAWFFPGASIRNIAPGHYRVYTWYRFLDGSGRVIGAMTEQPDRSDYGQVLDGAPDVSTCNTGVGTPGCIYVP